MNNKREVISYLVFGVLATIVNVVFYYAFGLLLGEGAYLINNILSWFITVVFAFVTNKLFVFNSRDWTKQIVIPELTKFVGCRIGSGIAETLLLLLTVDILLLNGNLMKLIASIIVVILNYFGSKFLVFKN